MKKFLLVIAVLAGLSASAQTFAVGDLNYTVTSGTTVEVSGLANTSATSINVPATVENDGTTYSVTAIGEAGPDDIVYRNGARDTDLICVSGDLGAAYMGLQLLERERQVAEGVKDDTFQPDFAGKEYLLERQLKPEARRDVIAELHELGICPTAMMDVSDGLSSELLHICKASGVGCRVYEDRIPIDYQTAIQAEEFNMNLVTAAMNGGEDYELLFTVPLTDHEKVSQMKTARLIGRVTKPELGACLVSRDNQEIPIQAQGWKAF